MSKGEQTREMILERAAKLFNRQGYFGSSLSDIMRETGLEKGGIYNHFHSKEDLALEAFDYAIEVTGARFRTALEGKINAIERLNAVISVFLDYLENSPVPGGCPILNTAVESDDTQPALRERAQKAMDGLFRTFRSIVRKGLECGEIRSGVNAEELASLIISQVEGALMLSKLYGDDTHLRRAVQHLNWYFENYVRA
ncbi:MAG TPA: TetR/AcrR family transcriptional regulator [Chloroflexia bacterium]|nr:TetR/AcrR family transcriptional regulator [Chloroflexia bacterium]